LLLLINLANVGVGAAVAFLAVYINTNAANAPGKTLFVEVLLGLGAACVVSAALGFVGAACDGGCTLRLSAWLAIPLALFDFLIGSYVAANRSKVVGYVKTNDASDAATVKQWYWPVVGAIFGAGVLEMIRYKLTFSLKKALRVDQNARYEALAEEEEAAVRIGTERAEARSDRYDQLRQFYRDKYRPPPPEAVEAPPEEPDDDQVNPLHREKPKKRAWFAGL